MAAALDNDCDIYSPFLCVCPVQIKMRSRWTLRGTRVTATRLTMRHRDSVSPELLHCCSNDVLIGREDPRLPYSLTAESCARSWLIKVVKVGHFAPRAQWLSRQSCEVELLQELTFFFGLVHLAHFQVT